MCPKWTVRGHLHWWRLRSGTPTWTHPRRNREGRSVFPPATHLSARAGPEEHENISHTKPSLVRGEPCWQVKVADQQIEELAVSDIQPAKTTAEATPLRRQPVQQRSARHVRPMPDARADE